MERFLDFQFRREIKLLPLFLNESFRAAAVSLLSVFSSIYVYKTLLGLAGRQDLAFLSVFTYFLGVYIFKLLANLLAEEFSLRWGLKKQIYLGLLFSAICLGMLFFSSGRPGLLALASASWGLSAGFYWFGRHGLMIKESGEGTFGKALGMAYSVRALLLMTIPALGGLIISFFGYQALFLASLLIVVMAGIVIIPLKERKTHRDTSLAEILGLFRTHKRMVLVYGGYAAAGAIYGIVIPLYLFLILQKELSLGEFFSLAMILVALVNLLIGRWVDLRGKRGLVAYGSIFQFFVWLGRLITRSIKILFIFDIIDRITGQMVNIPLHVLSYQKAVDGQSTGRATLFQEISFTGGAIVVCLLMMVIIFLGIPLKFSFWLAAVFSLLPLLLLKHDQKR